jgi:hypothetical protein
MALTDDYWLQDLFSVACGSTAESSDRASSLELGKYNHFTETYVLGVYKWDYRQLTYTIDGYNRFRQLKLPSMPSHEQKRYHPDDSDKDLHRDDMSYKRGTGWQVGCCMRSGVEIRRNWGPRLGSGGNVSILFRNSELEESYQFGIPFFCFFSSLHFSIPYYFFGSRPDTNGVGMGFYHLPTEVEFPHAAEPPKGNPVR